MLLLKELIRRIPACPSDELTTVVLRDLHAAHNSLALVTTELNSALHTSENLQQLKSLQRLFLTSDSNFTGFVQPGRKLLRMGVLRKKFSSRSYNLQAYKSYFFFLVDGLIWYAGSTQKRKEDEEALASGTSHVAMFQAVGAATSDQHPTPLWKMKHMYKLDDMFVDQVDPKMHTIKAANKAPNPLKFYMWNSDGRVIVLQAATEKERDAWFTSIDKALTDCKQKNAAAKKATKAGVSPHNA